MSVAASKVLLWSFLVCAQVSPQTSAAAEPKRPGQVTVRPVQKIGVMSSECAAELAACFGELPKKPGDFGFEVDAPEKYPERVVECAPRVLKGEKCSLPALPPSEMEQFRNEVSTYVMTSTGTDCTKDSKNPLCFPAPSASVPAPPSAVGLLKLEVLTEVSCSVPKNQVCGILFVRDKVGRQLLLKDGEKQLVFLNQTDEHCIVWQVAEVAALSKCMPFKLPTLVEEKGQMKLKFARK